MRAIYATDLSAASEAAIQNETCLECLGRIGVDTIHLVTVIPSNVHAGMPGMNFSERRKKGLRRYQNVMEDAGFDTETHVVRGTPHRRINGIAEAEKADMTIIGSRGQSPLDNRVIGSTARNLARTTVVPLLVNRIERSTDEPDVLREHLFQRVLYATDFSENAARAFDAFQYLRHATQVATLVHVESPKDATSEEEPSERLESLADTLSQWDIETSVEVRHGDPAEEILDVEASVTPTTTLVGSRGQSRMRRLLLGSVSEDIVARADGNVFLVPPPRTA
ncbi:Nucleotide-binding universal stress protein, UspA family [Haloarcula vallismortis]|uniref:Universal stress protein n=2 Tax=Haloarcula vallismortis TaxID=28442 RepID=M0JRM9_HALVA|nr:universal stress protein [Haloarcula vallismortis]EMA11018.1 universal stress protein [Haloarcula vallismortis ATCC 29715]SDX36683.1 Nucleotide-binding universal stress protein, UspA family [Haloarcula vallismortis]